MESTIDRFLLIIEYEDVRMPWLEGQTKIETKRWHNIKQRKVMRTNELDAFNQIFPEYSYWLTTGKELPEAGQISPMTKRAHTRSKTAPKAG